MRVFDKNWGEVYIDLGKGHREMYKFKEANMVVGNIVIGERYCEPQGESQVVCEETGDVAHIVFKVRTGWSTKASDENSVTAVIKDASGKECYRITGRYVESLQVEDLETGDTWSNF